MPKRNGPRKHHHPHILALVATKGGTGKSTVAACLAGKLHARGYHVALLDTDPQRTLTSWHDNDGPLKEIPIGTANGASVLSALQSMSAQHSVVLVDTAGFQNRDTLAVLTLADVALVPHIRAEVAATGARLLEASLHRRVAYAEAFLGGTALCFMGSSANLAAAEIAALSNELSF